MSDKIRLVLELDIEAHCMVHGTRFINMHPRILNLGYGRVAVDQGSAHCRGPGCNGTSQWITLTSVESKWNNASPEEHRAAIKHALEMEMGVPMSTPPPEDEPEEEVTSDEPEPRLEPVGTPTQLGFRRPRLGG